MKINFFLIVALFLSMNSYSQPKKILIDSLLEAVKNSKDDTGKIKLYTNLATAYYSRNPDSFFMFCQKGIGLAKQFNRKKDIALLDLKMSSMLTDTGNYKLSLQYAEESLEIATELHSKTGLINSYNAIGNIYDYQSDFVKSSDFFFKAMAIAEEINDHEKIALMGTNLAAASFNEGDFQKAEKYCFLTLREAQLANAPIHIYKAFYILGMSKATLKDTVTAENYYKKSIDVCEKNDFILNKAEVITDLANLQKDEIKKLDFLLEARKIYDALSPGSFESHINWENLGELYIKLFKSKPSNANYLLKAEECLTEVIRKSKESNDLVSVAMGLQNMAKVEELKGNYRLAYEYSKQSHSINDSIFSQENKNKIASLESRNEIDKKNQEIEKQKLKVYEQKKNAIELLTGLLLMSAIGLLFYRLSTIRKQKNKELTKLNGELDEANKVKAKFFGILSHDLRSPIVNLINFAQLQKRRPGLMNEEQIAERENRISDSAKSLLDTMEAMLLWSKGQMENFKPSISEVTVLSLFNYLEKFFKNTTHIDFNFYCNEYLLIKTDEPYLQTIMVNLTSNAVKALEEKPGAKIEWRAWKEKSNILLSIIDNGAGISEEQVKALYDYSSVTGSKYGLGLHIIRDLAKAIECVITMKTQTNSGTEFILSVPD